VQQERRDATRRPDCELHKQHAQAWTARVPATFQLDKINNTGCEIKEKFQCNLLFSLARHYMKWTNLGFDTIYVITSYKLSL